MISLSYFNVNLPKLLLGHLPRRAAHQILGRAAHGEGDDLPDVFFSPKEHDHPVNSGSHACVRGRAELEGVVERTEFLLQNLLIIARDLKGLHHHIQAVIADRAGGELHAVTHNIVLVRQDLQGILRLQRRKASLGHGKGINPICLV